MRKIGEPKEKNEVLAYAGTDETSGGISMKFNKFITVATSAALILSMAGCGGSKEKSTEKKVFTAAMITDTGGINDQSFNQSAWEGLTELKEESGASVSYIESKQASDFVTNLERLGDNGADLLWGIGYACADAILEAAESNPDIKYAIVDNSYENTPDNVTAVVFRAQESSFLAGYVAGRTTQTGKVGFVGGIHNGVIDQFRYGYQAGVLYAARELGKDIEVSTQYAESFTDSAKGKAIASKMYSDGCDVIYHAAGGSGTGVIEAAKEASKWVIGVDRDQAYLAPDHVLTSAVKMVGKAVREVSEETMEGEELGGQVLSFGLEEESVGLSENHKNMPEGVYEDAMELQEKVKDGEITPPATKAEFELFAVQ